MGSRAGTFGRKVSGVEPDVHVTPRLLKPWGTCPSPTLGSLSSECATVHSQKRCSLTCESLWNGLRQQAGEADMIEISPGFPGFSCVF